MDIISQKNLEGLKANANYYHLATKASMSDISNSINEEGIKYHTIIGSGLRRKSDKLNHKRIHFNCNRPFIIFVFSKNENLALLIGIIEQL
ncbi:hypothetical protein B4U80_13990 [Leptotrombidium deliense]|uniref:Serpin domain-containing protein n=1 Tax=Leptotrombidium deliense TaxID=299467 RepID=A0A443S5P9_9ACAR|nr:hypothetical protein B4U80_13990 [Leptotrombidium deliense]